MSGQIDPRLSTGASNLPPASQYGERAQHTAAPPPPSFSGGGSQRPDAAAYANAAQQNPHPYYHYPAPSAHHTPQQPGASGAGTFSNQASPEQLAPYQLPHDSVALPDQGDGGNEDIHGDDPKRPRACEACRGLKVRCDQDPAHPDIPCKRCAKAGRPCVITQPSRKRQKKADSRVAELEKKLDALTATLHQQQGGGAGQYGGQQAGGAPAADMMHGRGSIGSIAQLPQYGSQAPMQSPTTASHIDPAMRGQKRRRTDEGMQDTPSYGQPDPNINPLLSRQTSGSIEHDELAQGFHEIRQSWAPSGDLKRLLHHQSPKQFVDRINTLINQDMAATIFDRYITKLMPHLPAVVFPPGTTADQIFNEKPILYVCILSAASFGTLPPHVSKQIAQEAVGAIADCVVRNGAKSLELIQAMQVVALWYKPPEQAEQTNFYQIIHMAAVMALDIGLGKRFNPTKARRGFGGPNAQYVPGPHKTLPQDSDTLEARRAWLTCYYLCASASMVLRRPNLVRWTNYMKECIEVLESHPDAFASDKLLCQHVKIQHICEDIGLQFLMDDNTANISITDPKVSYALNVLEVQLRNWKENIPAECRGPGLQFFEHVTSLYLHEIALHFNHNIEDFRLPFTEESLKSVNNTSDTLTQNQMAALEACLKAAHGILDTMLSYDVQTVKTLPMLLFFVRCVYAIVILIKMHVAVCTPNSELGKMMKPEDLRVEHYIDGLIAMFGSVIGSVVKEVMEDFRPHPKILRILGLLREWFGKHKEHAAAQLSRGGAGENGQLAQGGQAQQVKQEQSYTQTPLHLLSQVATSGNQQHPVGDPAAAADWTFNSPSVVDFSRPPPPGHPDNLFPAHAPSQAQEAQDAYTAALPPGQQMGMAGGVVDPTNPDFGWGSGFEQAMDIALGGVDGLQGGGLDQWFLGDSMAPFAFSGLDSAGGGGGWQ
ncbi:hypothetical protein LTR36_006039 [Oleoguttula mirabilis]|uniref:Zn(2)-C6 fungal-type domain-containing protein n=1 Tax=Oleoguttula mirabilis TaxID=1507867 RepID=A0AAV9JEJ0_9PEZI|nr:hypothetical protein LTR36_006039 [Oleoguttula mirabilis]